MNVLFLTLFNLQSLSAHGIYEDLLRQFAAENLPPYPGVDRLDFYFPWHRMFIGGVVLPEK